MSQTGPAPAETVNAQVNPTRALGWDVFVTPGLPIVTPDKPPGIHETFFQAMAATLIYGARDAMLVDGFMTVKQATALADWVASRKKNLTTIYITHGHGDHWFGVATLLERFPNARVVATSNAVQVMRMNASPHALDKVWKVSFPGQIPDKLVIADELNGNTLDLEGNDLVAVELGHTDTENTTCLHVPSIGLVVAGDAAYNDVHLYLAESNPQKRREWIAALDKIESLRPRAVVASHKRPENEDNPRIIEERASTSVISTGCSKRRKPRRSFTTRCWRSIQPASIRDGRCGVRCARSNHNRRIFVQSEMAVRKLEIERFSMKTSKPFDSVVAALKAGVGRLDVRELSKTSKSATSFSDLEKLIGQNPGATGLMLFEELDHGAVLRKESGLDKPKILRFLIGNPLIMKEMAKHVPDAGSYAPVTILVDERSDGVCIYPTTGWQASSLLIEMPKPSLSPEISTRKSRASCENVPLDVFDALRI